jgi:hypothetical protein
VCRCTYRKYIYRNVYFTITAPVKYIFDLSTKFGEIRQTLDAKNAPVVSINKSVVFQLSCVQVI